tara:strand:+ start:198 stop:389 length:192 start_codon:yes stop_codon:yes gene_type:complete
MMSQVEQDMQKYAFNEGQVSLIACLRTTEFRDVDEVLSMLYSWESKLVAEQKAIDKKYEGLKE